MNSRLAKEFAPLAKNPAGAHGQRALVSCQFPGRLPFFSLKGSLDCLLYPCPLCHKIKRVQVALHPPERPASPLPLEYERMVNKMSCNLYGNRNRSPITSFVYPLPIQSSYIIIERLSEKII